LRLGPDILLPFYAEKRQAALTLADQIFSAHGLRYAIHASEGAFFHWLWLPELKIPSKTLYERLKARKTLIVPGEYFFFGLPATAQDWPHRRQCIRMNYAQPLAILEEAFQIIAQEATAS
jgi:valine--pyruvate aminotransferase